MLYEVNNTSRQSFFSCEKVACLLWNGTIDEENGSLRRDILLHVSWKNKVLICAGVDLSCKQK